MSRKVARSGREKFRTPFVRGDRARIDAGHGGSQRGPGDDALGRSGAAGERDEQQRRAHHGRLRQSVGVPIAIVAERGFGDGSYGRAPPHGDGGVPRYCVRTPALQAPSASATTNTILIASPVRR